ncbi:MAG: hypothetical protein ACLU8S_04230 [Coprococcus phoceensis]
MKSNIEELRQKYMDNPPEGMTSKDIRNMSEDELLDMDFFLNEDDLFADEAGVERFLYLLTSVILFSCPTLCGLFSFIVPTKIGISYYIKKAGSSYLLSDCRQSPGQKSGFFLYQVFHISNFFP